MAEGGGGKTWGEGSPGSREAELLEDSWSPCEGPERPGKAS